MKEERVLWFQAENLGVPNFIFKNGIKIDKENPEYSIIFNKLFNIADKVVSKTQPWVGTIAGYLFFKGTLASKDQIGRYMSFIYIIKGYQNKEYREILLKDLKQAQVSLSEQSMNCFDNYKKRIKYTKYFIYFILLLIILSIFIFKN